MISETATCQIEWVIESYPVSEILSTPTNIGVHRYSPLARSTPTPIK